MSYFRAEKNMSPPPPNPHHLHLGGLKAGRCRPAFAVEKASSFSIIGTQRRRQEFESSTLMLANLSTDLGIGSISGSGYHAAAAHDHRGARPLHCRTSRTSKCEKCHRLSNYAGSAVHTHLHHTNSGRNIVLPPCARVKRCIAHASSR